MPLFLLFHLVTVKIYFSLVTVKICMPVLIMIIVVVSAKSQRRSPLERTVSCPKSAMDAVVQKLEYLFCPLYMFLGSSGLCLT